MLKNNQTYNSGGFLFFFTKKLRLSNPWNYKVPLLITFPYLVLLLSNYRMPNALLVILSSVAVIIGVAGVGYLSNDLGDRKADEAIGKENVLIGMPSISIIGLFSIFLLFALLPWLYLPFNTTSCFLLSTQLLLFFVYALPPFRFKERGVLGLMTDSLYAHALPAMLAVYTFNLFTGQKIKHLLYFVVVVFLWQFVQGVRNILFHQIKDLESDQHTGTTTFVTQSGLKNTLLLLKRLILPLEVFLLSACVAALCILWQQVMVPAFTLIYFALIFLIYRHQLSEMDYRAKAYKFLDDYYIQWLPLFVLVSLSFNSWYYLPVLGLHLFLFKNGLKSILLNKISL